MVTAATAEAIEPVVAPENPAVPKGYQQTEAGIIPEDWSLADAGTVLTRVSSGKSRSSSSLSPYPLYGSTGVIGRCTSADYSGPAILVARVGANAGAIYLADGRYGVTDNTIILNVSESVDFNFIFYQLTFKHLNHLIFGSGQPLITGTQIKRLKISLPPTKNEQKTNARALSDADSLIRALERHIEKKRLVRHGLMQELLSGKRRLQGFRKEWEEKTFGQIFDFYPAATNSRSDLTHDGDVYYIHYGDIHTRFHSHLDFTVRQAPRIDRDKCRNAALLQNGDWIMADASEDLDRIGKSIEVMGLDENDQAGIRIAYLAAQRKITNFCSRV